MKEIKSVNYFVDCAGKTILGVAEYGSRDLPFFLFNDDTYLIIEADGDEDSAYPYEGRYNSNVDPTRFDPKDFLVQHGIIDAEELATKQAERDAEAKLSLERKERAELARLKQKFEA